jgi:hypothetical protein
MNTIVRLSVAVLAIVWQPALGGRVFGADKADSGGWTILFDGKSTDAFRGFKQPSFPTQSWVVDNGTLKAVPAKQVDLITKKQYGSFELELEWKVARASNSGIMFHVSEDQPETYNTGPEMQVVDDDDTHDGRDGKTSAGSLYALIAPAGKKLNPAGQWNQARLVVNGNHVEHWLNGVKVLEYELRSPALKDLIAHSKFKDMPRFAQEKTGHIALQNHGGEVWYRNVRIRQL